MNHIIYGANKNRYQLTLLQCNLFYICILSSQNIKSSIISQKTSLVYKLLLVLISFDSLIDSCHCLRNERKPNYHTNAGNMSVTSYQSWCSQMVINFYQVNYLFGFICHPVINISYQVRNNKYIYKYMLIADINVNHADGTLTKHLACDCIVAFIWRRWKYVLFVEQHTP